MAENRQRRNGPNGQRNIKAIIQTIGDTMLKHSRIVFPVILIACVAITVLIALNATRAKANETEAANTEGTVSGSDGAQASLSIPMPDEEMQNNAFPEVNALITEYFDAQANGDAQRIVAISNSVDEKEQIRIREFGKYVESYPSIEIYTKTGPVPDSYLAYVCTTVKMENYDFAVPGIQAFFVCTAEDGTLYFNEGEVEDYVRDYIQEATSQEDVVELYNKVNAEYNNLIAGNPEFGIFLQELSTQINVSVGEALAAAEVEQETREEGEAGENEGQADVPGTADAAQEPANTADTTTGTVQARTTTAINVRSSDSETADKRGKLETGTNLELLEVRANGWSKIMYEGKEAFVKTEYLEMLEDASDAETIGTVTAIDNVNIRAAANETAEKLGVIYQGETLELIEKQNDGWSKVKYKGQVAYVKSEYVQE